MSAKHQVTRREVLAAALGLGAARACRPARAQEPKVATQAEALYQDTSKGILSCAACAFFLPPRACKVVAGDISPKGWCKFFDLPD
jgi:uncharacterized membrane protein